MPAPPSKVAPNCSPNLGHDVHDGYPAELDKNDLGNLLGVSVAASVAHELEIIAARTGEPVPPDGVEPATWFFAERGRALTATQYLANIDEMHRYARRLHSWWEHNDILITPTMSEAAPPIGELKGADVERIVRLVPYTAPYNITWSAGHRAAAALDERRPATRYPTHQSLRRRRRTDPSRVADRSGRSLDRAPSARLRVISTS